MNWQIKCEFENVTKVRKIASDGLARRRRRRKKNTHTQSGAEKLTSQVLVWRCRRIMVHGTLHHGTNLVMRQLKDVFHLIIFKLLNGFDAQKASFAPASRQMCSKAATKLSSVILIVKCKDRNTIQDWVQMKRRPHFTYYCLRGFCALNVSEILLRLFLKHEPLLNFVNRNQEMHS